MRRRGLVFGAVLILIASVLFTAEYVVISNQIRSSKDMMQEGLLKAQGDLLGLPGGGVSQKAAAAQEKEKAITALRESRAQAEAARRRSGDPTPRVDAVLAETDGQLRALIGDCLVDEGNTVDGYRVQKVSANSVAFEKNGRVWVQQIQ